MTPEEIKTVVIDVLKEVQIASGREWIDLDGGARPIGAVPGFDSLCAIEATVLIEERMGCGIEVDTLFVSENGTRALTLNDVCGRIAEVLTRRRMP